MQSADFIYPVVALNAQGAMVSLRGTAFPVAPDGGFVTCRHVVDIAAPDGVVVPTAILDMKTQALHPITVARFSADPLLDLAFLPNALGRAKPEFLQILSPDELRMGIDVRATCAPSGPRRRGASAPCRRRRARR